MLLKELSNIETADAIIAERLSKYTENHDPLMEATARILRFNYERAKADPRPRVLVLGRWIHPRTGNKLVAGINLNYLDEEEVDQLNTYIPQIMKPNTLKTKWWVGYGLLPSIWNKAYRQYDERFIHGIGSASVEPELKDYEKPREPTEEPSKEPEQETERIKDIEDQASGEPPKEPKKSIGRFSKDTLNKIITFIKNKFKRNRQKTSEKEPQISRTEKEAQLDHEEQAQEKDEVKELESIEDEYEQNENLAIRVDMIAESKFVSNRLKWKSPKNYIHWHKPERFTEYQNGIGRIVDYAHGTKLIALYNYRSHEMIVDLAESTSEVLALADWEWDDTVRIVIDDDIDIEYDSKDALFEAQNSDDWLLIQKMATAIIG